MTTTSRVETRAMSAGAEPTTALPSVSATKTSPVEVASNRSPPPSGGYESLGSLVGAGASSRALGTPPPALLPGRRTSSSPQQQGAGGGASPRAATAPLCLPCPPTPRESTTGKLRRSLEYIRLSKSELNDKEQTIGCLRSENVKLQAAVRELRNLQQSHSALQSACSDLAQCMGCSVEGVAAESVRDILHNQATSLLQDRQQSLQQLRRCQDELERSKGEAAAASVQISSCESQIQQTRSTLLSRESELQRLQGEVERLRGSEARSNTALQSLRQRLTELEGARTRGGDEMRLSELHTEIGRLKKALQEKEEYEQGIQSELEASQAAVEDTRQRVANLEEMYEDLCSQLAVALHLDESGTHNVDTLISEVERLAQESPQLRLRTETLSKTLRTCELDSRASRETILRLVSEVKKHENLAAQLSDLQEAKNEQEALLESLEREKNSYQERLVAAKETMAAQEEELQAKDTRILELVSNWHSLKATADAESELIASEQQKYRELVKAIGSLISSSCTESVELLHTLEQVVQGGNQLRQRLEVRETEQVETGRANSSLQAQLANVVGELDRERRRVKQLEGELLTQTLVKEGLEREAEKERQFHQRLSKALKLDGTSAQVLSGDFARDAILVRAEQMTKHETQALAEKQSALYSAQRQLKTCRQTLESKGMYLGLLQKKSSALEGKVQEMSQREAHLENLAGKSKRLEKQVERQRVKMAEQNEELGRLRAESSELTSLKTRYMEQEKEMERQAVRVEELNQARSQQARQLAEARARGQSSAAAATAVREKREEAREVERECRELQEKLSQAREAEAKFNKFEEAVQRLVSDARADSAAGDGDAPSNYNLIARLELLVAEHKELRDTVQCLGPSLQQLEQGFRTGYSDTMAILQTRA